MNETKWLNVEKRGYHSGAKSNPNPIRIRNRKGCASFSHWCRHLVVGQSTGTPIHTKANSFNSNMLVCRWNRTNGGRIDWYINHNKWRRTFNFQAVAWVSSLSICLFRASSSEKWLWCCENRNKKKNATKKQNGFTGRRIKCYERKTKPLIMVAFAQHLFRLENSWVLMLHSFPSCFFFRCLPDIIESEFVSVLYFGTVADFLVSGTRAAHRGQFIEKKEKKKKIKYCLFLLMPNQTFGSQINKSAKPQSSTQRVRCANKWNNPAEFLCEYFVISIDFISFSFSLCSLWFYFILRFTLWLPSFCIIYIRCVTMTTAAWSSLTGQHFGVELLCVRWLAFVFLWICFVSFCFPFLFGFVYDVGIWCCLIKCRVLSVFIR